MMKHIGPVMLAAALAGSLAGGSVVPAADPKYVCCSRLARELPAFYHGPASREYGELVKDRWSGTAVLRPGCVITPSSARNVSRAVRVLTRHRCPFAVKAGGHNANPGANSINGGVSIDLGALNSTQLAADRSSVSLGAGVTWGKAYDFFNSSGIGFTGGVCEDVGVGGVSIGGGQSLFQAKKGWAVDNIPEYEVVLASGRIVTASQRNHQDLFKALKGGNTNFGIVTRVKLAAFEFPALWGGEVLVGLTGASISRSEMLDKISRATVDFVAANNKDVDSGLQVALAYLRNNGGQVVDLALTNTADIENPPTLQAFLDLPNQLSNSTRHGKIADFVHQVSKFVPKGFRQVTASVTITNDYQTLREIWDATDDIYSALPNKDKIDWIIQLIPQPAIQQSYAQKRGGNSLGLANNKHDQIVFWLASRWSDPSLDDMMDQARRQFIDVSETVAKKHGTYSPFLYINFASSSQNPLCGYGPESVAFLKKTAKRYDPHGVFQKLMPGGFKISQVDCGLRGGHGNHTSM